MDSKKLQLFHNRSTKYNLYVLPRINKIKFVRVRKPNQCGPSEFGTAELKSQSLRQRCSD